MGWFLDCGPQRCAAFQLTFTTTSRLLKMCVFGLVYANTLMASLNGRLSMKPEQASVSITDFGFGSVPCTPPAGVNSFVTTLPVRSRRFMSPVLGCSPEEFSSMQKGPRTPIQINKASEVYMQRDGPDSKTEEHEQFADEQLELKAMGNR